MRMQGVLPLNAAERMAAEPMKPRQSSLVSGDLLASLLAAEGAVAVTAP
jgi:hypothetical protein